MQDLFDAAKSAQLRDFGIEAAANGYGADEWIQKARAVALMIAARNGETDIEAVLKLCPRPDWVSPNATGAVMRTKQLKLIGYKRAEKVTSHSRRIGNYVLDDGAK